MKIPVGCELRDMTPLALIAADEQGIYVNCCLLEEEKKCQKRRLDEIG